MDAIEIIQFLLKERNLSAYQFAKDNHIPRSTLSNLFNHTNEPNTRTIEIICNALGITMSQFFAESNEPVTLNERQKELLKNWGMLTEEQKDALMTVMKLF